VSRRPSLEPVSWRPVAATDQTPPAALPHLRAVPIPGKGPEDVVVVDGSLYTGVEDGRLLRVSPSGDRIDVVADTGGRPLGIEAYPDGRLLVCDAVRGLLLVDPRDGGIEVLVAAGGPESLRVCNNAAVTGDGTIYFSDSSQRFDLEWWTADVLEHSGTGRLLRRDPDGSVEVLATDLQFANGVALSSDESFIVVAQTGSYELTRHWLTGERAGTTEVFLAGLPAFPDNLARGSDGLIWIAKASPRKAILDGPAARIPWLRSLIWALPEALHPKPSNMVWVRAVDDQGRTVHDYRGTHEEFFLVTGVREHAGEVYLGSLEARTIGVLALP
jgi:hypothetical protein